MVSTQSPGFQDLELDRLLQAVKIYLDLAYPQGELPEPVRKRVALSEAATASDLLERPPFERVQSSEDGAGLIYAIRLGNARYPHMKLQIQAWPNPDGFLLSVNTHDQVLSTNPNARDLEAFRQLQAENQGLKELIEEEWDRQGLPTFLRYLKNYISQHTPPDGVEPVA